MKPNDSVFVAGHRGLVGSALVRALRRRGSSNLVLRTRQELDLRDKRAVREFFESERPKFVLLAAARVGGIVANDNSPADFLRENLEIQNNVLDAARACGVTKLLFLGSSCIYPKFAPQPIPEEALLTGHLEPTNEAYAIAKIAGVLACRAYNRQYGTRFIALMPPNLYGPEDNFQLVTAHVLPAMIRKYHEGKQLDLPEVELWGTGKPRREFLFVDDLAEACLFAMNHFEGTPDVFVNAGAGCDMSIGELSEVVADVVGYRGRTTWNTSVPDGTPRKLLDTSRLNALGWTAQTSLRDGIEATYRWFVESLPRGGVTRR